MIAAAAVLVLAQGSAWGVATEIDFCEGFNAVVTNPLVDLLPEEFKYLLDLLVPPEADVNGQSVIDDSGETIVIDVHGNGMRDCDSEMGIISAVLADESLDLTATGGLTHAMVYDAWVANEATFAACVGPYWALVGSLLPGLPEILLGYMTIGDGAYEEDPEDVYNITGSGGFCAGLLTLLAENDLLEDPSLAGIENYERLVDYLAPEGDADGDGFTNWDEYQLFGLTKGAEEYVEAALDAAIPGNLTVDFSAAPTQGDTAPLAVQFTDLSDAQGGVITNRSWDFGDGGDSDEENPEHTYLSEGAFTVSLTVTTATDEETETKTDYITVGIPATISLQPVSLTVDPGDSAPFAVTATGSAPLNYQWKKDGAGVAGATESAYVIDEAQQADEGAYRCTVSNPLASVDSAEATLSVNDPPVITTQPSSLTVDPGDSLSFLVAATGTAPLEYQWQKDGVPVAGATASALSVAIAEQSDEGAYRCTVGNSAGSANSNSATLTVNDPPAITVQPASQTVNEGEPATFTLEATGTPPLNYQWSKDDAPLPGATAATYAIAAATPGDQGDYTCAVASALGEVESNVATLTVIEPPLITGQPTSRTADPGDTVTFTLEATGTAPLYYQWQLDDAIIPGAAAPTYEIASAQQSDEGAYTCVVANLAGDTTSDAATLTVNDPPVVTGQPASQTVDPGDAASFTVTATGTAPLGYQWQLDGADLAGATSATYPIAAAQQSDEGAYTCVVANSAGAATSDAAALTVNDPPVITAQPAAQSVEVGAAVTFTVTATGTEPLSYQWRKDGADLAGATSATYPIAATQQTDAGVYTVVVTNSAGAATSDAAALTITEPSGGCAGGSLNVPPLGGRFPGAAGDLLVMCALTAMLFTAGRRFATKAETFR